MRNVFFLITLTTLSLFALMFSSPISVQKEKNENGKSEEQDIAGAIAWWNNLRSNGETGVFNPQDMYAAMAQANAMSSPRDITLQWDEAGPDNVGGRTRAVLWDKNHTGVVFAGGVSGGLWKSEDNGDSWSRVPGDFSCNTVSCLSQAANGDIYFGTGEGFFEIGLNIPINGNITAAPGFPGQGVWKSTDGGTTWTHLSSTIPVNINLTTSDWEYVQKIACSPTDPNRVYAATNKGIKISTDGGANWFPATGTNNLSYAWDVVTGNDGYVYAIAGNQYYRSNDPDGNSFQLRQGQGGYLSGASGRADIQVSPSNPSYVYSIISKTFANGGGLAGIYKSTDNGLNWTLIGPGGGVSFNPLGFQGDYDITCAVLPSNPDVLFIGGQLSLYIYTPTLGWYSVSNWLANFFDPSIYIHADMHTIEFNPLNSNQFILGCDGGLFRSDNASSVYPIFESLDRNYNVTQTYSVAAKTTGEILVGCQDNGPQYIDFLGNTPKSARLLLVGDCMDVAIASTNQSAFYEEYVDGTLSRSANNGSAFGSFFDFRIDAPLAQGQPGDGSPDEGAEWVAPYSLWEAPDSSHSFFVLGCDVHPWFTLGALDFSTTPDWFQFPAPGGSVTCTAFSADGDNLFVGTSTGNLYRYGNLQGVYSSGRFHYPASNSTAAAWHATDSGLTVHSKLIGTGRYLRSIAVDPHNANNVVVTAARYGYTSYVWRSTDALDSASVYSDITSDLPLMPVWSSCIDNFNPNIILIGTDLGVYSRDITSGGWVEQNTGMDRVPVLQILQVPYYNFPNYTYIATYGRGAFHTGSLVGINDVKTNTVNNVSLFPNPAIDQTTLQLSMMHSGDLAIRVYDLNGREVYKNFQAGITAGKHSLTIPVSNLQSGTYIVNVSAGSSSTSHKMVVMK